MFRDLLFVFIGGGIGSVVRFGISMLMLNYYKTTFPLATLFSNVLSCAVLGLTVFLLGEKFNTEMSLRLLIITGFCGGFSTFSAFGFDTVLLMRSGYVAYAVLNVLLSVSVCIGIIYLFTRSTAS